MALWEAKGDHIVTAEPIEPHMDYHALYMTWYCRITCLFYYTYGRFWTYAVPGYCLIYSLIGLYHFNIMYILYIIFIPKNNYISFYVTY